MVYPGPQLPTGRSTDPDAVPLVIVEGFLGGFGEAIWGDFETHLNGNKLGATKRHVMFADVGPVSSLHDRACELYFTIVGGRVDYGEHHASMNGHARFGRFHDRGLYPEWSAEKPLHFLGHSMGGVTIVALQRMLEEGFFGREQHPDMMLSVTTVCAPFRGSQLVYTLGERTDAAPSVRPLSVGSALAKFVHVMGYLSPLLPKSFDLHADARNLSFREASFSTFLRQLWKSEWAESKDATPYDVTFDAADRREANGEGITNERTFYRSYVACMTERSGPSGNTHTPSSAPLSSIPLQAFASTVGSFDFSVLQPSPSFLSSKPGQAHDKTSDSEATNNFGLGDEYWANDGVVPLFSQWHPLACSRTNCHHIPPPPSEPADNAKEPTPTSKIYSPPIALQPGLWYVKTLPKSHHVSIMPFWWANQRQIEFWSEMGSWLRQLDVAASETETV
ncbi:alpha/beta-hydrolase [Dentipellis sp. KUC8613]|nr:alpha/beta-hydrolase [Dentipellis sp. KUC8613]